MITGKYTFMSWGPWCASELCAWAHTCLILSPVSSLVILNRFPGFITPPLVINLLLKSIASFLRCWEGFWPLVHFFKLWFTVYPFLHRANQECPLSAWAVQQGAGSFALICSCGTGGQWAQTKLCSAGFLFRTRFSSCCSLFKKRTQAQSSLCVKITFKSHFIMYVTGSFRICCPSKKQEASPSFSFS